MTNQDDHDDAMGMAFGSIPDGPFYIAGELRRMAAGEPPYTQFAGVSPAIRNIWMAAAEIMEETLKKESGTIQ